MSSIFGIVVAGILIFALGLLIGLAVAVHLVAVGVIVITRGGQKIS